jgi:hypothetical protein
MVKMLQKTSTVIRLLGNMISDHMVVGEVRELTSEKLNFYVEKNYALNLAQKIKIRDSEIHFPSYCDLVKQETPPLESYRDPLYSNNCLNKIVTLQISSKPVSPSGHNGNNETNTISSASVLIEFIDADKNVIVVNKLEKKIEFWIDRDDSVVQPLPTKVNATKMKYREKYPFIPFGFNKKQHNESFHLQLIPIVPSDGYIVCHMENETPFYNKTHHYFHDMQLFCPNTSNDGKGHLRYF